MAADKGVRPTQGPDRAGFEVEEQSVAGASIIGECEEIERSGGAASLAPTVWLRVLLRDFGT